jgi:hypothetical protein
LWKLLTNGKGLEIRRQEQRRRGSSRHHVRILVWGIQMRGVGVGILRLGLIMMLGCWFEAGDGDFARIWREEKCLDCSRWMRRIA